MTSSNGQDTKRTITFCIEECLKELGINAPNERVAQWLHKTYAPRTFNPNTIASTVYHVRRKMKALDTLAPVKEDTDDTIHTMISLSSLRKVRGIADDNGGIEEMIRMVGVVRNAAECVGGIHNLLESLEALKDLTS